MLQRTPDILGELGSLRLAKGRGPLLVGFAAETEDVIRRGVAKRESKHVDLIVANDVSRSDAGFDVDTNAVTIVGAVGPGDVVALPLQAKSRVAMAILDRVEKLIGVGRVAGRSWRSLLLLLCARPPEVLRARIRGWESYLHPS